MSNFSSNAQTAITAADAVAQLINPDTTSAQRASIAVHVAQQSTQFVAAFSAALNNKVKLQLQIAQHKANKQALFA